MSRLTKTMFGLLVVNSAAAVLFLTGIIDVSNAPGFYLAFPLAAILYGLFLICRALDKEVARFDAEQRAHHLRPSPEAHAPTVEPLHDHEPHERIAA